MENQLISIIVPVYNVERYLKDCIESILAQTYKNFELILVDDGSPDKCGKICDYYGKKDRRIKVIHKLNGGLSDARNAGIEIAKGDYIGFVDSDDFIMPDMYEKLLDACIKYSADISMCGRNIVNENKDVIGELFVIDKIEKYDKKDAIGKLLLWDSCDSAAWDKLYKRSIFEEVRYPVGVMSEDYAVTARLFANANSIVHVGEPLYNYTQRSNSITKQGFTQERYGVIYQVYDLTEFVGTMYPDLMNNCNYFIARSLESLVRFSQICKDVDCLAQMRSLSHECWHNSAKVVSCKFLSAKEKIIFFIRVVMLDIHIVRLHKWE